MSGDMTELEWAQKAEWEGGFLEAYFGYGLNESDLEDQESELAQLLRHHKDSLMSVRVAVEDIEDRLNEVLEAGEADYDG